MAIAFEIFAVQPAGRADVGVLDQRFGQPHAPRRGVLRRCGFAQVGEFVAEIPGVERGMIPHAFGDAMGKERLRAQQMRIGVKVADAER